MSTDLNIGKEVVQTIAPQELVFPDEVTRMSLERKYMDEYFKMRLGHLDDLLLQLGRPPDIGKVDPLFWRKFYNDTEKVADGNLRLIFGAAALSFGVGITVASTMAANWSLDQAAGVAARAVDGLQRGLAGSLGRRKQQAQKRFFMSQKRLERLKRQMKKLPRFAARDLREFRRKFHQLPKRLREDWGRLARDLRRIVEFEDFRRAFTALNREGREDDPRYIGDIVEELELEMFGLVDAEPMQATYRGNVLDELMDVKAEQEVITTTTEAVYAGTKTAQELTGAVSINDIWRTEGDDRVCPICRPWHNTRRVQWSLRFPQGPGRNVHYGCRCRIVDEFGRVLPFDTLG